MRGAPLPKVLTVPPFVIATDDSSALSRPVGIGRAAVGADEGGECELGAGDGGGPCGSEGSIWAVDSSVGGEAIKSTKVGGGRKERGSEPERGRWGCSRRVRVEVQEAQE